MAKTQMRIFFILLNFFKATSAFWTKFAQWDEQRFAVDKRQLNMGSDFLIGGMVSLSAYNMLLFGITKDRGYLFYSLFLLCFWPYFGMMGKTEVEFLGYQIMPSIKGFIFEFLIASMMCFFGLFTRSFFNMPAKHTLWAKVMFYLEILMFFFVFLHQIVWHNIGLWFVQNTKEGCYYITTGLNFIILIYSTLIFTLGFVAYNRNYPPARFFIIANTSAFIGAFIYLMGKDFFNILPNMEIGNSIFQSGLFAQGVLFSLGLADKINVLRSQIESERWAKSELEKQKIAEINALTVAKNIELEQKVFERTHEITERNQELLTLSEELQASLDQKQILLREIHHRVKNNLQIISSLLNLQSYHVKDQNTLAAIKEGQNRVISMALVHQKLYQNENMAKVEVKDFFEHLLSHLASSFERPDQKIQCVVDSPELWLEVDKTIPLGLIVNELVSNSFKYAFQGRETGKIGITLSESEQGNYLLQVWDDGVGAKEGFDTATGSLGLRLVKMLVAQIDGNYSSKNQNGLYTQIEFK
jgi:two-component sensor histidine kinase